MSYILPLAADEIEKRLIKVSDLSIHQAVLEDKKLKITLNYTLEDGAEIKFRAPASCDAITTLSVQYPNNSNVTITKTFAFADANGNNIGEVSHLFAENAIVKVILDLMGGLEIKDADGKNVDGAAFVQNADTNAYIESTFIKNQQSVDFAGKALVINEAGEVVPGEVGSALYTSTEDDEIHTGEVRTIYLDKDKTTPVYPRTTVSAITDENGNSLDTIINNTVTTYIVAPDWDQTNSEATDYIKNKPTDLVYAEAATNGIADLYSDKDKTIAIFPSTKINAVTDDTGANLDTILNDKLNGKISKILEEDCYGPDLPDEGTNGQIFFKLEDDSSESIELTILKEVLQKIYPVGSVYSSSKSDSPDTILGFGTWEQIKDRFLLAAGDTYLNGTTGGEATHTLTINEMPTHNHTAQAGGVTLGVNSGSSSGWQIQAAGSNWNSVGTYVALTNTGSGEAHNNMPPYRTIYMWERIG